MYISKCSQESDRLSFIVNGYRFPSISSYGETLPAAIDQIIHLSQHELFGSWLMMKFLYMTRYLILMETTTHQQPIC